jgi:hypothetical protein
MVVLHQIKPTIACHYTHYFTILKKDTTKLNISGKIINTIENDFFLSKELIVDKRNLFLKN